MRMQVQASWCRPEAVLSITRLGGLQIKTCGGKVGREKGEKEWKIRATYQENNASYFINIYGRLIVSQTILVGPTAWCF